MRGAEFLRERSAQLEVPFGGLIGAGVIGVDVLPCAITGLTDDDASVQQADGIHIADATACEG